MGFIKINKLENCDFNVFREIGKKWLLVTVYDKEQGRYNVMTASWGCAGVLWNKPVCVLFVRPQRHTYKLIGEQDTVCLNVLKEEFKDAHKICGSKSGRDTDKIAVCGLDAVDIENGIGFAQSESVIVLKQLYKDELKEGGFIAKELLENYNGDYHGVFVCEIKGMYKNTES